MMTTEPVPMPDRITGFRSRAINGILDYLDSLRPLGTATVRHVWTSAGVMSYAGQGGATSGYLALFDLYALTATTLKVRGTTADKVLCVAGVWVVVVGGTWELDAAITISANAYIYLNITRSATGATATLETAAALPDGDDNEEKWVLWYIPWVTDHIDTANILDYRCAPHITAMA